MGVAPAAADVEGDPVSSADSSAEDLEPRSTGGVERPTATALEPSPTGSRGLQTIGLIALAAGTLTAMIGSGSAGWQQWQQQQARQAQPTAVTKPAAAQAPSQSSLAADPSPLPTTGKNDQLLLRSRGPSWLEVKTETGTTLFRGTFEGERSFPLGGGVVVLAGRPDLVQAQLGSGAAQPLGTIDQVRWRRFKDPAP
jgi:cytoskeletal protein RodZ